MSSTAPAITSSALTDPTTNIVVLRRLPGCFCGCRCGTATGAGRTTGAVTARAQDVGPP
ncbi:hypothetical protein NKH18_31580 [Streptomyces sp. M10(2022)]